MHMFVIQMGGTRGSDYMDVLALEKIGMTEPCKRLIPTIADSGPKRDVTIKVLSPFETGFCDSGNVRRDDFITTMTKVGLQPCSLEVAPALARSMKRRKPGPKLPRFFLSDSPNTPILVGGKRYILGFDVNYRREGAKRRIGPAILAYQPAFINKQIADPDVMMSKDDLVAFQVAH